MTKAARGPADPLEREIEAALDPARFVGDARACHNHLVSACSRLCGHEVAASGRSFARDALATLTPVLTKTTARRPPPAHLLRTALYGYAFNPLRRASTMGPTTAGALAWLQRDSLPLQQLQDPQLTRRTLDA